MFATVRRSMAALWELGVAAYVSATYAMPGMQICRDAVAGSGVVRLCSPLTADYAILVAMLSLPAVMLLWPDVASVAFGGVTVTRHASKKDVHGRRHPRR